MKSKITIDYRHNEEGMYPVIKVEESYSDDVRDKLVKNFFQNLWYDSSWLHVEYQDAVAMGTDPKIRIITPVHNVMDLLDQVIERVRSCNLKADNMADGCLITKAGHKVQFNTLSQNDTFRVIDELPVPEERKPGMMETGPR